MACDLLIVVRYNEDIRWTYKLAPQIIFIDKKIGNFGRESLSYVRFIIENFKNDEIKEDNIVCFTQGNLNGNKIKNHPQKNKHVFDINLLNRSYSPLFGSRQLDTRFDACGRPWDKLPCLESVAKSLGLLVPDRAWLGGYFATRMQHIRKISLNTWWYLYNLHFKYSSCRIPYVLERLWESILVHGANFLHSNLTKKIC